MKYIFQLSSRFLMKPREAGRESGRGAGIGSPSQNTFKEGVDDEAGQKDSKSGAGSL